jgi:hypothetical protein
MRFNKWFDIKLFGKEYIFNIRGETKPTEFTIGITNETEDGFFIPFIDYDDIYYEVVVKNIKMLQREFGLGSAIVCYTTEDKDENGRVFGSYHTKFLDKMGYHDVFDILKLSLCDDMVFLTSKFHKYKALVHRISCRWDKNGKIIKQEPIFKEIIYNKPDGIWEHSYAHYKFLQKGYLTLGDKEIFKGYDFQDFECNFDNIQGLNIILYNTSKDLLSKKEIEKSRKKTLLCYYDTVTDELKEVF